VAGIGSAILVSALAACGSTSEGIANGKNCKHIAFLLPESATAARWEAADHPDVVKAIQASLPGATVDVTNAQGNATTQQTQADTALSKGACFLVVAPFVRTSSAAIVSNAIA
jgi:D-xylose transport system substrate-binding protein